MVQSIFDDQEDDAPREAPVSLTSQDALAAEPPRPRPVIETPFLEEQEPIWAPSQPPPAAPQQPPAVSTTHLDGTPRDLYGSEPRSVYAPMFTESSADTVRRSGLAWSMGVVFVGSVVIMLMIGWGADLLFGSSPWGLVLGIVLGSVIGFIQFFRISSQIYEAKSSGPQISPLMSPTEESDKDTWL